MIWILSDVSYDESETEYSCWANFTMNATTEQMKQYSMYSVLNANKLGFKMVYDYAETFYVYDTYQFNDYSKYDCNMFDEAHKAEVSDNQFPKDLAKICDLGKRLVEMDI